MIRQAEPALPHQSAGRSFKANDIAPHPDIARNTERIEPARGPVARNVARIDQALHGIVAGEKIEIRQRERRIPARHRLPRFELAAPSPQRAAQRAPVRCLRIKRIECNDMIELFRSVEWKRLAARNDTGTSLRARSRRCDRAAKRSAIRG